MHCKEFANISDGAKRFQQIVPRVRNSTIWRINILKILNIQVSIGLSE